MAGPLTELGQALALGANDYANVRKAERIHARDRAEMLTDEARRHATALGDIEHQHTVAREDIAADRTYEETLYNKRRYDAIKNDLVHRGKLKPAEADDPKALDAALQQMGVDYQRNAEELAGYKAMLPKIIEAVGTIEGADTVETMRPEDVASARPIVQAAYRALGARVSSDREMAIKNKQIGAALLAVEIQTQHDIQSKLQDIQSGVVTRAERQQAMAEAAGKLGYANEAAIPADQRGSVEAAASKIINEHHLILASQLSSDLRESQKRFDNIPDNVRAGIYGYLQNGAAPKTSVAPAPSAKVATPADTAAAIAALQGKAPRVAPAPAAAAVSPAALGGPAPSPAPAVPVPVPTQAPVVAPVQAPTPDALGGSPGRLPFTDYSRRPSAPAASISDLISELHPPEPVSVGPGSNPNSQYAPMAVGPASRQASPAALGFIPSDQLQAGSPDSDFQLLNDIAHFQKMLNSVDPYSVEANDLRRAMRGASARLSAPVRSRVSLPADFDVRAAGPAALGL